MSDTQIMSVEEWQSAIEDALSKCCETGGGMTMREIAELTGRGMHGVKEGMRKLFAAGRLRCRKELRPSIDGVMRNVPVYSIIEKPVGK